MSYSVIDISNKIIASTDVEQGELISNLKLQKLLYYVQGFHIAAFGKKLFKNKIEAWQYGPVVREAYFHFKDFGSSSIVLPEGVDEIVTLKSKKEELFQEVLEEYGQYSAIKLMNMTHEESPWKNTFHKNPQGVIDEKLIKKFFKTQLIG